MQKILPIAALALAFAFVFATLGCAKTSEKKIYVQAGSARFTATLENNAAASEWLKMLKESPLSLVMKDYGGFEKVAPLGRTLAASDLRIKGKFGDIMLYNGSNIVILYGSNSWSYTKLAQIDNPEGLKEALSGRGVTVVFTAAE